MRFYDVDGQEIDVQDLKFFIDEDEFKKMQELIEVLKDHLSTPSPGGCS